MLFWQIFTIPDVSRTSYVVFAEAYETDVGLSISVINIYDAPRYLKYWAKLYHNCKSDLQCSYKIYMISEVTCFFVFVGGRGGAHVTKYQPDPKSHCSRRGLNCYAMSLHPISIASIPRQKMWKKSILTAISVCAFWHLYRCLYNGVHLSSGQLELM